MSNSEQTKLLLYNHPVSSYAQKVRIALREKNIPFDAQMPEGWGSGSQNLKYADINPRLEVPSIVDGGHSIFDSKVILSYLEDKYPEPTLLPGGGPALRAKARMIEEICDAHYDAINWGWGEILWFERATGELREKLKSQVAEQTKTLQKWLADQLGENEFFCGNKFTTADVAVAPMLGRSMYYGFTPEKGSALLKWYDRIKERPSVTQTFAEFEQGAAKMSDLKDTFLSGERRREYRDHRLEFLVRSGGLSIVQEGISKNNIRFSWPYAG